MHYYHFNIADYRKDTTHLTRLEHSIYRDLIDWYYLDESPIPVETQSVMRRLRLASQEELKALENVLNDFFYLDGMWRHKRIDQEIIEYHVMSDKNKKNGKLGGRPKKTQSVTTGLPLETQVEPKQKATTNQEPLTINHINTTPIVNPDGLTPVDKPKNGLNCPHQKLLDLYHTECKSLAKVARWSEQRKAAMASLWKTVIREEKFTTEQQGLEYFEGYFNWIEQSDFLCGRTGGDRPFMATIDWILKPANFTKIIESNYHRRAA